MLTNFRKNHFPLFCKEHQDSLCGPCPHVWLVGGPHLHHVEPCVWTTVTHFTEQETEAQRGRRTENESCCGPPCSQAWLLLPDSRGNTGKGCCLHSGLHRCFLAEVFLNVSVHKVWTQGSCGQGLPWTQGCSVPGQEWLHWGILLGRQLLQADCRARPLPLWVVLAKGAWLSVLEAAGPLRFPSVRFLSSVTVIQFTCHAVCSF